MADENELVPADGTTWNELVLIDAGTPTSTVKVVIASTIPASISQQNLMQTMFEEFALNIRAVMGAKMDEPDAG